MTIDNQDRLGTDTKVNSNKRTPMVEQEPPDLALLINAGVYEYGSWFPTLAAVAAHGFPTTITTLSHLDHACSRSFLAALSKYGLVFEWFSCVCPGRRRSKIIELWVPIAAQGRGTAAARCNRRCGNDGGRATAGLRHRFNMAEGEKHFSASKTPSDFSSQLASSL